MDWSVTVTNSKATSQGLFQFAIYKISNVHSHITGWPPFHCLQELYSLVQTTRSYRKKERLEKQEELRKMDELLSTTFFFCLMTIAFYMMIPIVYRSRLVVEVVLWCILCVSSCVFVNGQVLSLASGVMHGNGMLSALIGRWPSSTYTIAFLPRISLLTGLFSPLYIVIPLAQIA